MPFTQKHDVATQRTKADEFWEIGQLADRVLPLMGARRALLVRLILTGLVLLLAGIVTNSLAVKGLTQGTGKAADSITVGSRTNRTAYPTTGTVVDPAGGDHPAADVEVVAFRRNGEVLGKLRTDGAGTFQFPEEWWQGEDAHHIGGDPAVILLVRDDQGRIGWADLQFLREAHEREVKFPKGREAADGKPAASQMPPVKITILASEIPISGWLVGPEGDPVAGVRLEVRHLNHPINGSVTPHHGLVGIPVDFLGFHAVTDEKGQFRFELPSGSSGELLTTSPDWVCAVSASRITTTEHNLTFFATGRRRIGSLFGSIQSKMVESSWNRPDELMARSSMRGLARRSGMPEFMPRNLALTESITANMGMPSAVPMEGTGWEVCTPTPIRYLLRSRTTCNLFPRPRTRWS